METVIKPQMSSAEENYVIKRNGTREPIDPNKITRRLKKLKLDVEKFLGRTLNVSVWRIAKATIGQIYDGITTSELDEEAAEVAAYITDNPDYADFAGNILVSNLEANNRDCMSFLSYAEKAYNFVEERTGHRNPLISDELMSIAKKYSHHIDRRIVMCRNYLFDYFAFQTLAKGGYILNNYRQIQKNRTQITAMVPFETPQHMYMRVALGIHGSDLDSAFELYDQLSLQFGTMATPTLFNAGTPKPQNSSCFLLQMKSDSIEGIFDTAKQCALISKQAGGIGVNIHNIRASGSYIKGTNGTSNGLVPMLRVFNNIAKYVDQGGGKRKGSFAFYLEPWHADILAFLEMKLANGAEDKRARDLFYALWVPDLFWKRVQKAYAQRPDEPSVMWSLMCPHICPGLSDCYGEEFEKLYEKYEEEKKYNKQIPIKDLMKAIMSAQIETGTPYICNKDHANRKSNQNNLGVIKSSNLCSEIYQYSSEEEVAVCLSGETIILTENGLKRIDECDNESVFVPLKSDTDFKFCPRYLQAKLIDRGEKQTYTITTISGNEIHATENHKFLRIETGSHGLPSYKYDWVPLSDLKENDKIYSPGELYKLKGYDVDISVQNSTDFMVAGWLLGDGWQLDKCYGVCFGPTDTKAMEVILPIVNKWQRECKSIAGGRDAPVKSYTQPNGVVNWSCAKKSFMDYVSDRFGMTPHKGPTKEIPYKIMRSSPIEIASYLSGLYSADGCVMKQNAPIVSLSSASHKLLQQVQLLLHCFGIAGKIIWSEIKSRGTFQGRLDIRNRMQLEKFQRHIGFILCPRKQELMTELMNKFEYKQTGGNRNYVTVKSIRLRKIERVYDLSLENGHHFLANGLVVHNCNLASLSLPAFVDKKTGEFDYASLERSTRIFTKALNKVIDVNYYPVKEAENSNMWNRPIGLGVQGLADVFVKMRLPFTSDQAKSINRNIAEVMYFGAMSESHALAVKEGYYPSMLKNGGAPISKGIFQFELWKPDFVGTENPDGWKPDSKLNLDWEGLRANILKPRSDGTPTGVRNSLVICKMPTASTSCIMGNTECFEPYFGMIYVRRTKAGEFFQYCRPLIEDLIRLGLWKTEIHPGTKKPYIPIKEKIKEAQGSIQNIPEIPEDLKKIYVTVFDLKLSDLTIMARDRAIFTDQSESLNVYFKNTDNMMPKLLQYLIFSWKLGLKTSSYYCRTLQQTEALNFSGMNNHEAECISCSG